MVKKRKKLKDDHEVKKSYKKNDEKHVTKKKKLNTWIKNVLVEEELVLVVIKDVEKN